MREYLAIEKKYVELYIDYEQIKNEKIDVKVCLEKFRKAIDDDWSTC